MYLRFSWFSLLSVTLFSLNAFSLSALSLNADAQEIATFAGGCFWCMQPPYDKIPGVISTRVGYTGGQLANPNYQQVSAGGTGHCEAVEITFDPTKVNYQRLLDIFWHNVDPTQKDGQFVDKGSQYRSEIFFHNPEQGRLAEESKAAHAKSGVLKEPIVTAINPAGPFYPAEEYHQKYYQKNPLRYKFYRNGSGRDKRLKKIWGP